jgi:hypothetical protein|tara:strand:+ start:541 stop:1200 length:660 start_codon:yes stop_codon:yes gene_type:complete
MIKLAEILTLDKLVYSETIPKDDKAIMDKHKDTMFADFDLKQLKSMPPPRNSSNRTLRELISLDKIMMPVEQINAADDIDEYFRAFFQKNHLEFPKDKVRRLIKDSRPLIQILKYYYNRPRPEQIAKAMSLKFHNEPLESAKTPAYPSGHSIQGMLVGKYLATMYPEHANELMGLADDISKSRLAANVHYPTDSIFGEKIALALYLYMRNTASLGMEKI